MKNKERFCVFNRILILNVLESKLIIANFALVFHY